MLAQRLVTGALLIAGLLGLLWADDYTSDWLEQAGIELPWWLGGPEGLLLSGVAIFLVAPLMGWELARLLRGSGIAAPTWVTAGAAMVGVATVRLVAHAPGTPEAAAIVGTAIFALLLVALLAHTRGRTIPGVVSATGGTLLAFAYLGVLLGVWLLIRDKVSVWVVAGAMLTVKSSDTGAYFTGRLIGKHKLIPWLSPGKTWEGFVGGVVASAAVGALLASWSMSLPEARDHVPVAIGLVGGALLGIVSPVGDLAESLLKRSAGAKDSGATLPGMGGALDVLDSPLLAGPVIVWLLYARSF